MRKTDKQISAKSLWTMSKSYHYITGNAQAFSNLPQSLATPRPFIYKRAARSLPKAAAATSDGACNTERAVRYNLVASTRSV